MAGSYVDHPSERNLIDLIDDLRRGDSKQFASTVEALKSTFDPKGSSRLANLDDSAWHKIYEELFQVVVSVKPGLAKAKKSSQVPGRLTQIADLLRVILKAGVSKISAKTLTAIIDHITQILPTSSGEYCGPLLHHYLKALTIVVEHQANSERLANAERSKQNSRDKERVWPDVVDFCCQGINQYVIDSPRSFARNSSLAAGRSLSARPLVKSSSASTIIDHSTPLSKSHADDLLQTLHLLVSPANAPIALRYKEIYACILKFWHAQGSNVTQSHQLIFSIINNIILHVRTDEIVFTQSIASEVVPIISRFWQGKTVAKDEMLNSVRDEILIFMFMIHPHLERSMRDGEDVLSMLEELSDVLKSDYARRSPKDQMQLDDLTMVDFGAHPMAAPFCLQAIQLRDHNTKSERNWAHLQIVGIVERLINIGQQQVSLGNNDEELEKHPRKRQRVAMSYDRMLEPLQSYHEKRRLAGLQTLPYILINRQLVPSELQTILEHLQTCSFDKRGEIPSWAMLALSRQKSAAKIKAAIWKSLWDLATRALTFSNTCRAAAVLLHAILARPLLHYHDVDEDISRMVTSADTSGPAIVCDSAIFLMVHLLHARIGELPSSSLSTSQHAVRWLFARWNPSDRSFAAHQAIHVPPNHIVGLLRASLGLHRLPILSEYGMPYGCVAQAWQRYLDSENIIQYLLLLDNRTTSPLAPCGSCPRVADSDDILYILDTAHFSSARKLMLELLLSKCSELFQSWKSNSADRTSPVSTDTFRSAIYGCLVMFLSMPHFAQAGLLQLQEFEACVLEFSKELLAFLSDSDARDPVGTRTLAQTLLQSVQPYLPSCTCSDLMNIAQKSPQLLQFFVAVTENLRGRRSAVVASSVLENDTMDLDDDFDDFSQHSHARTDTQKSALSRNVVGLDASPESFEAMVYVRLLLVTAVETTEDQFNFVPDSFIDHLIDMSDEDILLSHSFLHELVQSNLHFETSHAAQLLERVGFILSSREFDRCEPALVLTLELLDGLSPTWLTAEPTSKLGLLIDDLYPWFIKKALKAMFMSPEAQKKLAELLLTLMRKDTDYGIDISLPSARSSLFVLYQTSHAAVKFYIAEKLPSIFHLFLFDDHDDIFRDILAILDNDSNWLEGIYIRMFALARLASEWSSLLRRCTYHIFEIPGTLPEGLKHAIKSLSDVSRAINLKSSRELFALFAPQILYTWLAPPTDDRGSPTEDTDEPPIGNIKMTPFEVFGFSTLRDLVLESQAEVVGLMVMNDQTNGLKEVAEILGEKEDDILVKCFTKVLAYTVAYDTSVPLPSSSGEKRQSTGVSRVKRILGTERFFGCLSLHFVDIIALLFTISDPQDSLDKYLARKEETKYAAKIMAEIKALSPSRIVLPPMQQPAFRAKTLTAQIQHLCDRTELVSTDIYTPALVTFVARKLADTIHKSLGSLHACTVLRKVRTLICLAGESATTGYPLEMLVRLFRPFINDPQCADDALGVTQYLLSAGHEYLATSPTFVAGTALSILGSIQTCLNTERASSTQESQYQSTLSKVHEFRTWFGAYLENYQKSVFQKEPNPGLVNLLRSAYATEWVGNAGIGSSESRLLLQLLQDEQAEVKLLSGPSREIALEQLCSRFEAPKSFREDALGDDKSAISNALVVWNSCRHATTNKKYLAWAGRVLGRAFVASGYIDPNLLRESALEQLKGLSPSSEEIEDSEFYLLTVLQELTLGYDNISTGIAETALRITLTTSDERLAKLCKECISPNLFTASMWAQFQPPPSDLLAAKGGQIGGDPFDADAISGINWVRDMSVALARSVPDDTLLCAMIPALQKIPGFAERAFPFILHLVLQGRFSGEEVLKKRISASFTSWFSNSEKIDKNCLRILINAILYLRTQFLQGDESSDILKWLNIDYMKAAAAATRCGMYKTALLFVEEHCSVPIKSSRRSSVKQMLENSEIPTDLSLIIFQNIDDPDLYYGVQQQASLKTILGRFEYEKDGSKGLALRGAQFDSHIRRRNPESKKDIDSLAKSLDNLSLSGLSYALLQGQQSVGMSASSTESMFRTARKLEEWDIPVPGAYKSNAVAVYKAFQTINTATDYSTMVEAINEGFDYTMSHLVGGDLGAGDLHGSLQTLATLVEMDEVFTSQGSQDIEQMLGRFRDRSEWMKTGRFDDVSQILSCRGTTLSTLSQQPRLRSLTGTELVDTRLVEVQASLLSSSLNRAHDALQESLSLATSMTDLIEPCQQLSLNLEASIQLEAASSLWDHGETTSSIGMLQALDDPTLLKKQTIAIGRSVLLSKIGHQVSVARLETAEDIREKYLLPALEELSSKVTGSEAGEVFHQFAVFCDQQLTDPDSLEDLERLKKLRDNKKEEVEKLQKIRKESKNKERYNNHLDRAIKAYKQDDEDLQREISLRQDFLKDSLKHYLLALAASDDHDSAALRFTALWLEYSEDGSANNTVSSNISTVPSRKFAPLMNQLTSRLQNSEVKFYKLLFALVLRICAEHPFHGMYQIYAGVSTIPNQQDAAAISRIEAAKKVSDQLKSSKSVKQIWSDVVAVSRMYGSLAGEKNEERYKTGNKIDIKESPAATKLSHNLRKHPVPSLTMDLPIAANQDYSTIPVMVRLGPVIKIASGVSMPKIITAVADNGKSFTQLVKGGHDDLRQDAIMEQVFGQVSELLKINRSTRQRDLKIRTYKVLPLTPIAGVIEFVPNTIPLHDYLIPAHARYYPKDLKGGQCRKEIQDAQPLSIDNRVKKYRNVTDRFHPVMRYFFIENFVDPDEWFVKRNAYTRSTAAISILGHILGLGDRHQSNILLDKFSGEIVHIDLGVAFEMGRLLKVPEIVPFRLTRDIVDGMGITKTEGVFRRCCEFTLEALRKEAYSIMTILDVLRYDPLYSWSISPARIAKLQEGQGAALNSTVEGKENGKTVNEPGEADRALTVINKKLSKTLSVQATVNDLINQASDERNLALMYSGWAAYA
ncbi:hypothetical protein HYALB_00008775 [Hymenoscyphus albidus]|uniref:Serine/threonine-protein kinase Tel1 n=1 Tax=Hymenoscyphus albidus TaxID=595503 RepID=A0A9N9PS46_9HELO|nr:hypothetical protein HYALB_00008775 [Hymenoscyphus albidus]